MATVPKNKRIEKYCLTIKQAERYQNSLYNKHNSVQLVTFPLFSENGLYVWQVS